MLKVKDHKWVFILALWQFANTITNRHYNYFTNNMLLGRNFTTIILIFTIITIILIVTITTIILILITITINVVIKMLLLARLNGGSMVDWAPTRVEEGKVL